MLASPLEDCKEFVCCSCSVSGTTMDFGTRFWAWGSGMEEI
jgi:hypothetical protein